MVMTDSVYGTPSMERNQFEVTLVNEPEGKIAWARNLIVGSEQDLPLTHIYPQLFRFGNHPEALATVREVLEEVILEEHLANRIGVRTLYGTMFWDEERAGYLIIGATDDILGSQLKAATPTLLKATNALLEKRDIPVLLPRLPEMPTRAVRQSPPVKVPHKPRHAYRPRFFRHSRSRHHPRYY